MELVFVTGTIGSGKTSVLDACAAQLTERRCPHVAVDMDALRIWLGWIGGPWPSAEAELAALAGIAEAAAARSVSRMLIADAVDDVSRVRDLEHAVESARTVVVRLTVPQATLAHRIEARGRTGRVRAELRHAMSIDAALDAFPMPHVVVSNEGPPQLTASEVIAACGWA